MHTMWKSTLTVQGVQVIETPSRAKFQSVQVQNGEITLWYSCDSNARKVNRIITIVGTGHPIPRNAIYIGTVLTANDSLVWHIYEVKSAVASS